MIGNIREILVAATMSTSANFATKSKPLTVEIDMKYLATATSKGNIWTGKVIIQANTLVEAQDKFFAWLKEQSVYSHMWNLEVSIEETHQYEVI
jgi:uncharacterized protein YegJ (DUF2314 family)